uniref:Uncharacterized protein n=1 Tax=Hippocampus comes TaxID=109280 RepID=A0A3Q2YZH3_HIPCM
MEEMKQINLEYQAEIHHLISGSRYDGKEDFAVVLQPFLHNSFIPYIGVREADTTFFSVDCFHISERAHAEMAIALWNNMLEPVGRKQAYNNFTYDRSKIQCPTEVRYESTTNASAHPCAPSQPLWVPLVVGVVSLLVGIATAWFVCSFVLQKRSKGEFSGDTKATGL